MSENIIRPEEGLLQMERLLPGPIERVWNYLTDPGLRATWFAGGILPEAAGGEVEFHMLHSRITTDEPPVDAYRQVHFEGISWGETVLAIQEPHRLQFTWTGSTEECSEVTFDLIEEGDLVRLRLTHRLLTDRNGMADFASGWNMHLDVLELRLSGRESNRFWSSWKALREQYARELGI